MVSWLPKPQNFSEECRFFVIQMYLISYLISTRVYSNTQLYQFTSRDTCMRYLYEYLTLLLLKRFFIRYNHQLKIKTTPFGFEFYISSISKVFFSRVYTNMFS
uniref:Uncharacterized protein n=1 Tax=Cacopsylla melanoneura TaxID=428564 RepID=A0A8D8W7T2_9HEMI